MRLKLILTVVLATGCTAPKQQHFLMLESPLPAVQQVDTLRTPEYVQKFYHGAIVDEDTMMAPGSVYRVVRRPSWNRNAFNGNPQSSMGRTNVPQVMLSEPTVGTSQNTLSQQLSQFSSQLGYVIQIQTNARAQYEAQARAIEERLQKLEKEKLR